jgi:hypothetical protein
MAAIQQVCTRPGRAEPPPQCATDTTVGVSTGDVSVRYETVVTRRRTDVSRRIGGRHRSGEYPRKPSP